MLLMAKFLLFILFIITNPFFVFSQFDEFFFNGFSEAHNSNSNKISLNGSSEIKKNGILQLTNDTSRLTGHAIYQTPFQFKNSTNGKAYSFSTSFAFAIVSQFQRLGGHGFAFTISPDKLLNGFPSPYLGVFNPSDVGNLSNHVFAVEFDTVQDFEFGDIDDNHIGIDIDGLNSTSSVSAAYFAENSTKVNITLKSGNIFQVWIDYDSIENVVNVSISPFSWKPKQPILSTSNIDLSSVFEDSMYVGFSSSTGLLASSHYILGWNFKMNGISRNLDLGSLPSLPGPKKKHVAAIIGVSVSSILLLIVAVCFAIYLFIRIKNADVIEDWELDIGPHRFSYEELKTATKGFKEKELLGVGGFGGLIFDVVDPRLKDEFDEDEVLMVLKLGLMCSNCAPAERPSMRQVVRYLEKEVKMPEVLSAPGENETDRNDIGFDDFIHSYPSYSFDKSSQSSKEVRNDAIENDSDQDQNAASSGSLRLLSTRHDEGS
ncbi:hypothetical protein MKW92_000602 [Papaver armeniacum]|nr:hypothetical protein MKW92_000602 [Papaver armeniacum]